MAFDGRRVERYLRQIVDLAIRLPPYKISLFLNECVLSEQGGAYCLSMRRSMKCWGAHHQMYV